MKPIIKELEKSLKICESDARAKTKLELLKSRHTGLIRPLLDAVGFRTDWINSSNNPTEAVASYVRWARPLVVELKKLPDLDAEEEDNTPETEPTGGLH